MSTCATRPFYPARKQVMMLPEQIRQRQGEGQLLKCLQEGYDTPASSSLGATFLTKSKTNQDKQNNDYNYTTTTMNNSSNNNQRQVKVQFTFTNIEYYDFPAAHSLNPNCWWNDRELEIHQKLDMIDAQQPHGHRRGLEQHFKNEESNSLRRDLANIQYVPSVVNKYKMSKSLVGKALRRASTAISKSAAGKDEQLQKYCTKSTRKNLLKALRLASNDEVEAFAVYEDADVQKLMDDSTKFWSAQEQRQEQQPEDEEVDHRRRRSSIMKPTTTGKFESDSTDQTADESDSENDILSTELDESAQLKLQKAPAALPPKFSKPTIGLPPRGISC